MSARRMALVTGASSGIGQAMAAVFAANGFDLVVTARRISRLDELADKLAREYGARVEVIALDLITNGAALSLCAEIEARDLEVDAIAHCAGFGLPGGFLSSEWPAQSALLTLHASIPAEVTYRLLPGMIDRNYGRIIYVSSIAGLVDSSAGTVYGGAKAFVVSFARSLSREVRKYGVYVTCVCPGLTRTEFHDLPALKQSVRSMPDWLWTDPSCVAQQAFDAVMQGRPLLINGRINQLQVAMLRYVPRALLATFGRVVLRSIRR